MAKQYKINGSLCVSKDKKSKFLYIGEDTDITHIDKDEAKAYGIAAKEFDKLVDSGVLTPGDGSVVKTAESNEPKPVSATQLVAFNKAVEKLDSNNEKHWTTDKKPEVPALKELGIVVTADQRDELWDILSAM